jgi:hypothetical protein
MSESGIKKRMKNLKPIQKGQVLNPLGAGAHNQEIKKLKNLSNKQIAKIGSVVLKGNLDELKEIVESSKSTVLQVWFARIAIESIKKGDVAAFTVLLNRIAGTVTEKKKIEHTGLPAAQFQQAILFGSEVEKMTDTELDGEIEKLKSIHSE